MRHQHIIFIVSILFLSSCSERQELNADSLFELLPSTKTGIHFKNTLENTPSLNILNYLYFYNGSGVAIADFNNDNLPDIYFTANQTADRLYINKGNMSFEDITLKAAIDNNDGWTTGVTVVDINNDELLDIYVCKVGQYRSIKGNNLLYVNQGNNEDGIPIFKEQSKQYGLNIVSFATQAAFVDYDQDNDLDLYLMNHSVHPNSNYRKGSKRQLKDPLSGDRLYENRNGLFVDISETSKIFQGNIGYGLGLAIGDLNNDSFPDIYIGNDFFENDYLYVNNKDKTFEEIIHIHPEKLGHTSHYSMGNTIADINNDGLMDILSLDMLPEDLNTYKRSGKEFGYQTYSYYLKNGYSPQFMQNTLHLNRGNLNFSELAHVGNVAATEWSWCPLVADFDNDGFKDIYITNGILGATNDMDFINFIANDEIQKKLASNLTHKELQFIEKLPKKKTPNYFFKNQNGIQFKNVSNEWISQNKESYSNGAAFADLDNDGDLDIVVNNIHAEAFVLKNNTIEQQLKNTHFLKVHFHGPDKNPFGIGATVTIYGNNSSFSQENYPSRGYLSSVSPTLHFGIGGLTIADSLHVLWSDGKQQTIKNLSPNASIVLDYQKAIQKTKKNRKGNNFLSQSKLAFKHKDNAPVEFNRDPLIPYALSNCGPDISVADINGDHLDDLFISGGKGQPSALFIQSSEGNFREHQKTLWSKNKLSEDISHDFGDIDRDGDLDLIVVSGGNEFKSGKAIQPRLYLNHNGNFTLDEHRFKALNLNASKVRFIDFNDDGNLDICILSDAQNTIFGQTPKQYLLENNGSGNFTDVTQNIAPDFQYMGNAKDFLFTDINNDQKKDLIVVGHWMPITVFLNRDHQFIKTNFKGLQKSEGWWNVIKVHDFDHDGDLDIMAGNWGLNTRLKASEDAPITLYNYDFDGNNTKEPIISYYYQGEETIFPSKEELGKQVPSINKKYLTHASFADASFKDIFNSSLLKKADKKNVFELATCYFENKNNREFIKKKLPQLAQISSINDIFVYDFNNDSYEDVLMVGNNYEVSTQLSKLDASHGELFLNDQQGNFLFESEANFQIQGVVQVLKKIQIKNRNYLLVGRNNDSIIGCHLDER